MFSSASNVIPAPVLSEMDRALGVYNADGQANVFVAPTLAPWISQRLINEEIARLAVAMNVSTDEFSKRKMYDRTRKLAAEVKQREDLKTRLIVLDKSILNLQAYQSVDARLRPMYAERDGQHSSAKVGVVAMDPENQLSKTYIDDRNDRKLEKEQEVEEEQDKLDETNDILIERGLKPNKDNKRRRKSESLPRQVPHPYQCGTRVLAPNIGSGEDGAFFTGVIRGRNVRRGDYRIEFDNGDVEVVLMDKVMQDNRGGIVEETAELSMRDRELLPQHINVNDGEHDVGACYTADTVDHNKNARRNRLTIGAPKAAATSLALNADTTNQSLTPRSGDDNDMLEN